MLFNLFFGHMIIIKIIQFVPRYVYYQNELMEGQGLKLLALYSFLFIIVYVLKEKISKEEKIYIHMLAIVIILQTMAYLFSLFTRMTNYFSISIVILIHNIVYRIRNKKIKIFCYIVVVVLSLCYFLIFIQKEKGNIVPYKFYFQI